MTALPGTTQRYKTLMTKGQTPKKLAAKHGRMIRKMRDGLIQIAGEWTDISTDVQYAPDAVLAELDELETTIAEAVIFLEEALPE